MYESCLDIVSTSLLIPSRDKDVEEGSTLCLKCSCMSLHIVIQPQGSLLSEAIYLNTFRYSQWKTHIVVLTLNAGCDFSW